MTHAQHQSGERTAEPMHFCSCCQERLPQSCYPLKPDGRTRNSSACRACTRALTRARRALVAEMNPAGAQADRNLHNARRSAARRIAKSRAAAPGLQEIMAALNARGQAAREARERRRARSTVTQAVG